MLKRMSRSLRQGFVVVVLGAAAAGYAFPGGFEWVGWSFDVPLYGSVDGVIIGLGIIMLGMGMTLSWASVRRALKHPHWVLLGVLLQYLLMPLIAFVLVLSLGVPDMLAVGVILVGCCPGGTASNVIAFLSRADVPLSVSITLGSSAVSPLVTPLLVWLYAQKLLGVYRGRVIEVPTFLLVKAILLVVVPILVGLILKRSVRGERPVPSIERLFTLISVLVIGLIVGYIVGQARPGGVLGYVGVLAVPVLLHNVVGLGLGYVAGWGLSLPIDAVRTLAIEVGMQNSGLAVALAGVLTDVLVREGADPERLAALGMPAVLFSVWHNVTGPLLASWWGREDGG